MRDDGTVHNAAARKAGFMNCEGIADVVMAGLVPAIPRRTQCLSKRDHRDKPGDDNLAPYTRVTPDSIFKQPAFAKALRRGWPLANAPPPLLFDGAGTAGLPPLPRPMPGGWSAARRNIVVHAGQGVSASG
jgi:hypothetical protein